MDESQLLLSRDGHDVLRMRRLGRAGAFERGRGRERQRQPSAGEGHRQLERCNGRRTSSSLHRGGGGSRVRGERSGPALRQRQQNEESVAAQGRRVALAFGLALPVFILSMFVGDLGTVGRLDLRLAVAMLAALPVYVISGGMFHRRAWAALRRGTANMDVLVHLGTTVAMVWSSLSFSHRT